MKKDGKYGFVDKSGKIVIPLLYDNVWSFSEGFAGVMRDEKWGYVNTAGEETIPLQYGFRTKLF